MANPTETPQASAPAESSVDFTTYILSIRETALVLLGLAESEHVHTEHADLDEARLQIDLLSMLHLKTSGNLTDDEDRLLRTVLYEVRVAWVQRCEELRQAGA